MRRSILSLLALGLTVPASMALAAPDKVAAPTVNADLAAAVANPLRDKDRARDAYRRPADTLAFFQVAPDMKVGEYAPGGEWYSRLLGGSSIGIDRDPRTGRFVAAR